ncbi:hypothetical protein EAO71_33015 [Streptomyces sp. ms191]|nr:hypothetical protein EAO71_33015 [Streptomyces sp. ms191]
MGRMKRAAVAVAVIALGATSCETSDTGSGAAAAPASAARSASPRPAGTGPLTKDVVRADLDTSAADAGVPENAPDYARTFEDAPAGSPPSCAVAFRAIGDEAAPLDFARFKAVVGALRAREWQQSGGLREHETLDGVIGDALAVLKQRGWTIDAKYEAAKEESMITLTAYDQACMKEYLPGSG